MNGMMDFSLWVAAFCIAIGFILGDIVGYSAKDKRELILISSITMGALLLLTYFFNSL